MHVRQTDLDATVSALTKALADTTELCKIDDLVDDIPVDAQAFDVEIARNGLTNRPTSSPEEVAGVTSTSLELSTARAHMRDIVHTAGLTWSDLANAGLPASHKARKIARAARMHDMRLVIDELAPRTRVPTVLNLKELTSRVQGRGLKVLVVFSDATPAKLKETIENEHVTVVIANLKLNHIGAMLILGDDGGSKPLSRWVARPLESSAEPTEYANGPYPGTHPVVHAIVSERIALQRNDRLTVTLHRLTLPP